MTAGVVDDAENFFFPHDEIVLTIELDLLPGVLAEENHVAGLDVERRARAIVLRLALAGGDHLALLRFFFGGIGDDDSSDLLFAFVEALDDEAVVKRSDIHGFQLLTTVMSAGGVRRADTVHPAIRD